MEKKQVQEENRLKEEEVERLMKESEEKQMAVQVLKNELEYIKRLDEEHLLRLEKQKREIEVESKERVRTLELQLQDAQKKMREIEVNLASELSILRLKDAKCQEFLSHHAQEYKVCELGNIWEIYDSCCIGKNLLLSMYRGFELKLGMHGHEGISS
jgi:hypothetical protein